MSKLALSLPLLSLLLGVVTPSADLPRGRLLEHVASLSDPGQGYALFLPSAYDPARLWPILYCFDPGGRGRTPVALFQDAAEKYGWILVGSNNSRNGPWEEIFRAVKAFWTDSHARLAIDPERIYACGFSGGARVASGLRFIVNRPVAGVILSGAGLPSWLFPQLLKKTAVFAIVGRLDYNYEEMMELDGDLDETETPHWLEVFAGKHAWPPRELLSQALAWLEALAEQPGRQDLKRHGNERRASKE